MQLFSGNKVLSVYSDKQNNIWLGLENGISIVKYNSQLNKYGEGCGLLKNEYTNVFELNGLIYTTTVTKLFASKNNGDKIFFKVLKDDFERIEEVEVVSFHDRS